MTKFNEESQQYKNFKIEKYKQIPEIQVDLIELVHLPTNAKVVHIKSDDPENLFSLSFKTLPDSSNGAPHILEHTVLCGSKKFPVKDPFFSMLRRSLNTFMNAMTGADFTCYPAASQVEKDFYNLLEIYLDAVFHPNLKELSFMQEGHRFEFTKPDDPKSPLIYKGVVYNEMKGAMSSSDSRMWHAIMEKLLPDTPYAFNSGGEPSVIPSLSYEGLKEFHKKYYHPSRCTFYFYGNLDLKKHLDFIEKNALENIEKLEDIKPIKKQKRFSSPISCEERYPIAENEPMDDKTIISYGFLTAPIGDQEELLALSIIDNILMGTDASILKREIIKSDLCTQVDSIMDLEMSEVPYVIMCKGAKKENKEKLFEVIQKTLKELIEKKLPQNLIEAAIHQIEFSKSEITRDHGPFGLLLFFKSVLLEQHGVEGEKGLIIHSLFNSIREKIKDPDYLTNLIKKYFIENTHLVKLSLIPDPDLEKEENEKERKILDQIEKKLSENEKQKIVADAKRLLEFQKDQETASIECLPKLDLKDIPKNSKDYPLIKEKINSLNIYHHNVFTNNILYTDLVFNLPNIDEKDLSLLSLFSSILTELGANSRDYISNLEYIQEYTGGIEAYLSINGNSDDPNKSNPTFSIGGKALYRNSDKLFDLIKDISSSVDFNDKKRIKDLILEQYTLLNNYLPSNAMKYALSLSTASINIPSYLNNKFHGIYYYQYIKELATDIDNKLDSLIADFKRMQKEVLLIENADLVIGADEKHYQKLKNQNFFSLSTLNFQKKESFSPTFTIPSISSQARIIASPVAFNAASYKTISYKDPDSPALLLSTKIFENRILHTKIREQGGAYGSGASYSPLSSIFSFHGFRDPHIANTLSVFKFAILQIAEGKFTDEDIFQAKLGIIRSFDSPISPEDRAMAAYSWLKSGRPLEKRQEFREKVLLANKQDIQKAVAKHLLTQMDNETFVTFAGKDLLEKEKDLLIRPVEIISI